MICYGSDTPIVSYKSFKNSIFAKKMDKMKNLIKQIDECSLRKDDKLKLKEQMIDALKYNPFK